jgi:hypothetical protein
MRRDAPGDVNFDVLGQAFQITWIRNPFQITLPDIVALGRLFDLSGGIKVRELVLERIDALLAELGELVFAFFD